MTGQSENVAKKRRYRFTKSLETPASVKLALIALSVLNIIGIYISELLIKAHVELKIGDTRDTGLCAISELFSCKAAAQSSYSELFEIPIAVIGEAYYICVILMLVLCRLLNPRWGQAGLIVLGITTSLTALYSVFLGGVSYFTLGVLCPLCIGLYLVNGLSLLVLAWLQAWRPRVWSTYITHPLAWIMALLMGISLFGTQAMYAQNYRRSYAYEMQKRKARLPVFVPVRQSGAPLRGDATRALIIEFSDFQCPFCRRFSDYLKDASQSAGDQPFGYAFRHFPLSAQCNPYVKVDRHPRACHAALASICAQEQGKFWELHDLLFEHQHALSDEDLKRYAADVGLESMSFAACMKSARARERLRLDIEEGHTFGVPATPVFFVNGWRHLGAKPPKTIKEAVARYGYESPKTQGLEIEPKSTVKEKSEQGAPKSEP